MTFRNELLTASRASGRPLEASVVEACARHFDLLLRWNQTHNLTRIVAAPEAARKHYLDCLVPLMDARDAGLTPSAFVDVGSGAGFPGLLASLVWPEAQATLVEPAQKRASFLMLAAGVMGVNVTVVPSVDATPEALALAVLKVPLGALNAPKSGASRNTSDPANTAKTSDPVNIANTSDPANTAKTSDPAKTIVLSRATFSPGKRSELVRAAGDAIAVWGHGHDGSTWQSEVATWGAWRVAAQQYAVEGLEPRCLLWAVRGEFHVKHLIPIR